jgi:hypothetical protein
LGDEAALLPGPDRNPAEHSGGHSHMQLVHRVGQGFDLFTSHMPTPEGSSGQAGHHHYRFGGRKVRSLGKRSQPGGIRGQQRQRTPFAFSTPAVLTGKPLDHLVGSELDRMSAPSARVHEQPSCQTGRALDRGRLRNSFGFQPLAEDRGLPDDASDGLRATLTAWDGSQDAHGTTWITWGELAVADWSATDRSGSRSRSSVAGPGTHWAPVWDVMRTLAELHGPEHVRLVVWFD